MPRPELYLPPGTTVETTTRTLRGMFLLPATKYFAKIVPLHGIWINRSKLCEARRRGKTLAREEYVTDYYLKLAPLPCWKDLPPAKRSRKVREMIADKEAEAADRRLRTGKSVLGMASIQAQSPLDRPAELKKTRRPLIHAASKVERQSYLVRREFFVEAYHEASTELLQGGRDVVFPCWSFPPGLPFVRSGPVFEAFWDGCVEKYQPAEVGFDSS